MAEAFSQIVPIALEGVVSCPSGPAEPIPGLQYFLGGHPMPNEGSLRAGEAILELLNGLPADALVIFCISGGASAIAEWPLDPALPMAEIIATNRALVHSGAPIAEINAIRKHLSAIKGGRMAQAACSATQVSLFVSDVPEHALDALASGPTMPDSTNVADCYELADRYQMLARFPARVRDIFEEHALVETPKPGDPAFARSRYFTLLSSQSAVDAAADIAQSMGFAVSIDNSCDDWDYARAADYLLGRLSKLRQKKELVCLLSGGEVTVTVGSKSGTGGRNQQFALYCAEKIQGKRISILSAGTDGIDGNSSAAGAIVDGTSLERVRASGLDPERASAEFDAFPILETIGDAIVTGPTGNNVRDLRILLAY